MKYILTLIFISITVLFFQNCGKSFSPDSSVLSESNTQNTSETSVEVEVAKDTEIVNEESDSNFHEQSAEEVLVAEEWITPDNVIFASVGKENYNQIFNIIGAALDNYVPEGYIKAYPFTLSTDRVSGSIAFVRGNYGGGQKDIAVSTNPGKFKKNPGCYSFGYESGSIRWTIDGATKYSSQTCKIEKGKKYYLNVKGSKNDFTGYVIESR